MSLASTVAELTREAAALEEQTRVREAPLRAPVEQTREQLARVEAEVLDLERQLRAFNADLSLWGRRPALTLARGVACAASLGLFTFGAAAAHVELARVGVGLFAGAWVAFLLGALRGR